jgi:hypothetical protein
VAPALHFQDLKGKTMPAKVTVKNGGVGSGILVASVRWGMALFIAALGIGIIAWLAL